MQIIRKLVICLLCFTLGFLNLRGQGVLFSEYRIILNDNAITSMYVTNPTEQTYNYTMSFVDKTMDENGKISDVPEEETPQFSIKKYLRIFPRSIVLEPGKSQEVQIQLKTPASFPDGEYRSFIHFMPREPNHQIEEGTEEEGVKMAIQFHIGSAIPIIYRKNATIEEITIEDISLSPANDGTNLVNMNLKRKGSRSVYGKILITGLCDGKMVLIASTKGSNAIYCEIPSLRVSVPIKIDNLDRDINGKIKLHISYIDSEKQRVKNPEILAQKEVELNIP